MLLEPVDPNEEFRERRRRSRRRRARRRVAVLAVFAVSAAVVALGASFLNGRGHPAATQAGAVENQSGGAGTGAAPAEPEPVPLPDEIRGVHVTMALASLDGKLDEYFALTVCRPQHARARRQGRERRGRRSSAASASRGRSARRFRTTTRARRRATAEATGVYLIGRVVVFEDPRLSARRARSWRSSGATAGVWTNNAGLAWTNPYDKRVWKYNVDVAVAAVKAGFDEIMFDYVRFPTDGDVASAVFKGRRPEHKSVTIANFLEYATGRLEPLGRPRLGCDLRAHGDARDGHRPAAAAAGAPPRRDLPDGLSLPLRRRRVQRSTTRTPFPGSRWRARSATSAARSAASTRRSSPGSRTSPSAATTRSRTSARRSSRPATRTRAGSSSGTPSGVYTTRSARRILGPEPGPTEMPTGVGGRLWKMWKNELSANCGDPFRQVLAGPAEGRLDSPLRRARSASRSKPHRATVGGSRKLVGEVDESETGSANFFGPKRLRA